MADEINNFHDLLDALDGGQGISQLTRVMRENAGRAVEMARDNGKGKSTMTLEVTFSAAGQSGATTITYSVKGKPAPMPTQATILYGNDNGTFTSRDPRQQPLKFASSKGPVS